MNIPAMTPTKVHDFLYQAGTMWRGEGVAMELGCWLGATSAPLLRGLVEAGYDRPYYAYDKWRANDQQIGIAAEHGITLKMKQNIQPIFYKNVSKIYDKIICNRGNIDALIDQYPGDPIEICIYDAPKRNPTFDHATKVLSRYWIPGVTLWGLLDYWFYAKHKGELRDQFAEPVRFMQRNQDCFVKIKDWRQNYASCVFFRYMGGELKYGK